MTKNLFRVDFLEALGALRTYRKVCRWKHVVEICPQIDVFLSFDSVEPCFSRKSDLKKSSTEGVTNMIRGGRVSALNNKVRRSWSSRDSCSTRCVVDEDDVAASDKSLACSIPFFSRRSRDLIQVLVNCIAISSCACFE